MRPRHLAAARRPCSGARACFSSLVASPLRFETAKPTPPQPQRQLCHKLQNVFSILQNVTSIFSSLLNKMKKTHSTLQNVLAIFSSPRTPRSLLALSQAGLVEHAQLAFFAISADSARRAFFYLGSKKKAATPPLCGTCSCKEPSHAHSQARAQARRRKIDSNPFRV